MKRISSTRTFVAKRVFPLLWLGAFVVISIRGAIEGKLASDPGFFVGPLFVGIVGYLLLWSAVSGLADEVLDFGEYLVVKRGAKEDRIDFANIMDVDSTRFANPTRITLRLVHPGKFGRLVAFSPISKSSLLPLEKSPIAENLIARASVARSKLQANPSFNGTPGGAR